MGQRFARYIRLGKYKNRVLWCLTVSVLVYCEWLVYWNVDIKGFGTDKDAVRILVVADPQIVGERYEPPVLQLFTHWDGDRYLRKGFSRAVSVFDPHIIVYLGDLVDEGSVSNEEEYARYRQRFATIFTVSPETKELFLPGDNDIGGEGFDRITPNKTERFTRYYQRTMVVSHGRIDIIPVNRLLARPEYLPIRVSKERIRILVSHIPILPIYGQFSSDVVERYKPHLVLSAHTHEANCFHVQLEPRFQIRVESFSPEAPSLMELNLPYVDDSPPETLTEFAVPTCSYRMGVRRMGYGLVEINESTMTAKIAVLWLPERFPSLILYLLVALLCLLFALFKFCVYIFSGRIVKHIKTVLLSPK